jgi:hypothetical protein
MLSHVCGYSSILDTSKKYPWCKILEYVRFTCESLHNGVELYSETSNSLLRRKMLKKKDE